MAEPGNSTGARQSGTVALLWPAVFAWLGVNVSILLTQMHAGARSLFCPNSGGCDAILASKFAKFFGIPLAWYGVAFYLLVLALALLALAVRDPRNQSRLLGAMLWLAIVGASFSVVLMVVQFVILNGFCPLCTASAVIMMALVFVVRRAERLPDEARVSQSRAPALALAAFAVISLGVLSAKQTDRNSEVVAEVDDRRFTREEMERELGASRGAHVQAIYTLEARWVQDAVDSRLLASEAQRQNVSVEELVAARVQTLTAEPNATARRELAVSQLVSEIAGRHRVAIRLKRPPLTQLRIDLATAKISGRPDARVQLVVFSDFQCQFCARLAAVIARIREKYPHEVLVAFRYFPLEAHPRAIPAAIAAECAAEQGRFWEYHDQLFAAGGDFSDEKLNALAAAAGLDAARFEECRKSERARQVVEASYRDAVASGLEGAPALFLDGTHLGSVVEEAALMDLIEQRLRTPEKGSPKSTQPLDPHGPSG